MGMFLALYYCQIQMMCLFFHFIRARVYGSPQPSVLPPMKCKDISVPTRTRKQVRRVDSQTTLEMIYEEVRKVTERLTIIEEVIEEVLMKGLPEVELSEDEKEEIKASIEERRKGEYVTLEALERA